MVILEVISFWYLLYVVIDTFVSFKFKIMCISTYTKMISRIVWLSFLVVVLILIGFLLVCGRLMEVPIYQLKFGGHNNFSI